MMALSIAKVFAGMTLVVALGLMLAGVIGWIAVRVKRALDRRFPRYGEVIGFVVAILLAILALSTFLVAITPPGARP